MSLAAEAVALLPSATETADGWAADCPWCGTRGSLSVSRRSVVRCNEATCATLTTSRGLMDKLQMTPIQEDETTTLVREINRNNFLAPVGGSVAVYRRQSTPTGGTAWVPYRPSDWTTLYATTTVAWGHTPKGQPKYQPLGKVWLVHPERRQYEGIDYLPGQPLLLPGSRLNLWGGYAIHPEPGNGHARWLEHAAENICNGDDTILRYVLDLLAVLVQRPAEPWGVALVLRGGQGTGKGSFVQPILDMFGPHASHVHSQDHFTGRFNGHLGQTSLLYVDEGYWSGGKGALGQLKGIITDPTVTIESKYRAPIELRNTMHVVMASNEAWVVPAGAMERRFLVLDVGEARAQDGRYFEAMRLEMAKGGTANLLHQLLAADVTDFRPMSSVPRTHALSVQRGLSLEPVEQWWHELLLHRALPAHRENGALHEILWDGEDVSVGKRALHASYREWINQTGHREHRSVPHVVGILLSRVLPSPYPMEHGRRPDSMVVLPSCDAARTSWQVAQGGAWSW